MVVSEVLSGGSYAERRAVRLSNWTTVVASRLPGNNKAAVVVLRLVLSRVGVSAGTSRCKLSCLLTRAMEICFWIACTIGTSVVLSRSKIRIRIAPYVVGKSTTPRYCDESWPSLLGFDASTARRRRYFPGTLLLTLPMFAELFPNLRYVSQFYRERWG